MGTQFAHERNLALRSEMNDFATQSAKASAILNGGGAVAMLGLLQALVQKQAQFASFRPFGLLALAIFVIGALAVPSMFIARYMQGGWLEYPGGDYRAKFWIWVAIVLMWLPVAAFLLGCVVAGIGIEHI